MAVKNKKYAVPLPKEFDTDGQQEEAELEDFASLDQTSAHVMVYRCGRPGEPDAFVDTITAAGITPILIRDNYGPGKYRLRCIGPAKQYLGHKTMVVGEIRINPPGGGPALTQHVPSVIDAIREENRRQSELIQTLISTQKPASIDFAGLAAILTALKPAGNGHAAAGTSPEATLEVFFKGFELARKLDPPPPVDNSTTSMLTTLAKELLPGILMGTQGGARTAGELPPAALTAPQSQPPVIPAKGTPPMTAEIAAVLTEVKKKCLAQVPPDLYIGLVQAYADTPQVQRLIQFVYANEFDDILKIDPSIASEPFRSYFQGIYDGLRQLFKPSDSVDDDTAGPRGDEANPARDGGLGKAG